MRSTGSEERRRALEAAKQLENKCTEMDQLQTRLELTSAELAEANKTVTTTREQLGSAEVDAQTRRDAAKCEMQSMEAAAAASFAQQHGTLT